MLTLQTETVLYVQQLSALKDIAEASAVIYLRELSPALTQEIDSLLANTAFTTLKLRAKASQMYTLLQEALPTLPHLAQDIQANVALFAEATGCRQVDMQLSAVAEDMCRKFHTDRIDFRLLCSYAGIGTQFILPEKRPDDLENIPETLIEQVGIGNVMIFRGALSASEALPALLHKSPPAKKLNLKRLLLRLDTTY